MSRASKPNGRRYHEIAHPPHESPSVANAAIQAFLADVEAAREKHRIADVLVALMVNVTYEDGQVGSPMLSASWGNILQEEALAAYAYGQAQSERRERMAKLIAHSVSGAKP